jgi:hypothetical protein
MSAAAAPPSNSQLGIPPISEPCSQVISESKLLCAAATTVPDVGVPVVVLICPPEGVTATGVTAGTVAGVGVTAGETTVVG